MTQLRKEEENLQADIATTAEHLAERDGAALLQEKYHQKLETLENLLESWEQGRKELEEKQGAYQREIKKRDALRETYQAMESLFLDAQAGILAEKLTEGEPCPVCGAIHHPQPARRAEHTPDKETLDHKKEELRMQEEAAAGQSEAAGSCRRQVKEKRAQLTEWLLRELPESQKEHEQKRLSQMPDVLFQQEAVEKAEQLRKEEETQKVRQMEYAELEKTQTSQQEKLETLKQAIAGAQADLGRAEGTQKALEEQLNKEISEAEKEPGFEETIVSAEKKGSAEDKDYAETDDRNFLAGQIEKVLLFWENRQKQCGEEIRCGTGKDETPHRMHCTAKRGRIQSEKGSGTASACAELS